VSRALTALAIAACLALPGCAEQEASAGTSSTGGCDPNYSEECLDPNAADYDCASGDGDGPEYVDGPVQVVGEDHFGLNADGNGTGCESSF
jgi:hypothetical protein